MAKILYYGGDKLEHPGIGDMVCIPSYRYDVDRGLGLGMQVIKTVIMLHPNTHQVQQL